MVTPRSYKGFRGGKSGVPEALISRRFVAGDRCRIDVATSIGRTVPTKRILDRACERNDVLSEGRLVVGSTKIHGVKVADIDG